MVSTNKIIKGIALFMFVVTAMISFTQDNSVQAQEPYESLRAIWKEVLTGGSNYDASDSDIREKIDLIDHGVTNSDGTGVWDKLQKGTDRIACDCLWLDLNSSTKSSHITASYTRLKSMALALSTRGSSLENNDVLTNDIVSALDWLYENRYFPRPPYDNWWDWEIGVPLALNDTMVLLYPYLTPAQIQDWTVSIDHFSPNQAGDTYEYWGANRVWRATVHAIRGIVGEDEDKMVMARDGLSDLTDGHQGERSVFKYVTTSDGFYTDGSFIQHKAIPYTGGYGLSFLADIGNIMYLVKGTPWEITDPESANLWNWIYDSFEPVMWRNGLVMDMVRGREIARHHTQDVNAGYKAIAAISRLSMAAPSPHADRYKSMIKYWISNDDGSYYKKVGITSIVLTKSIVDDQSVVTRGDFVKNVVFNNMARAVHQRPGFAFGLSMFSDRTQNFEWHIGNGENKRGWYTAEGMTYLYTSDLTQYNDNFWATVNHYRLPGTTVDTRLMGDGHVAWKYGESWVGGTSDGQYGVVGMHLRAANSTVAVPSNLTAKKSWFMFDDEVVALGAGITSTDNRTIETIVDNRKLNVNGDNELTINGTFQSGSLTGPVQTRTGVDWIHLQGNVEGADVGYYFPTSPSLKTLRETRTADWKSTMNTNTFPVGNPSYARHYMTFWFDHGFNPLNASYEYVILPNKSSTEVDEYTRSPHIQVLENSDSAQAVREASLNVVGANFWTDETRTITIDGTPFLTSNKKSSVLTRESADELEISVSDPTQLNTGTIDLEINREATGIISMDPGISVIQFSPTIKFKVNVADARGKIFHVKFDYKPQTDKPDSTVLTGAVEGNSQVLLTWDFIPEASGYTIHYGTVSGVYTKEIKLGPTTTYTVTGLHPGVRYYFAVTASNPLGESALSNERSSVPLNFVIMDNRDTGNVNILGDWTVSTSGTYGEWYGPDYIHDESLDKGNKSVTFTPNLGADGIYDVFMMWRAYSNRPTNVPVDIKHAEGTTEITVNQQINGSQWYKVGTYTFEEGSEGGLTIRTNGTGTNAACSTAPRCYVVADAVKFVRIDQTTMEVQNASGQYGDEVVLEALLKDQNDQPVMDGDILFQVNGVSVGTARTDTQGKAVMSYKIDLGVGNGADSDDYDIRASYTGNDTAFQSGSEGFGTLTVTKETASIAYTGSVVADVNDGVTLSAAVQETDGSFEAVEGLPVRFSIWEFNADGTRTPVTETVTDAVYSTDADGTVTVPVDLPAGYYEVQAELLTNAYYTSSSTISHVAVVDPEAGALQMNGHIELTEPSPFMGQKARKVHLNVYAEVGGSQNIRIHAEPQGQEITLDSLDWLIIAGDSAFMQGKTELNNATYSIRLMVRDEQNGGILSMTVWEGGDTSASPVFQTLGAAFEGLLTAL